MKPFALSLLILPLMAGAALAETSDRAAFLPLAEPVSAPVEPVRRAAPERTDMGRIALAPADVKEVDVNRDGKISFAELLLHDVQNDF